MPGGLKQLADTRTLTMIAFSATAGVFIEYYDFFTTDTQRPARFRRYSFPGCRLPRRSCSFTWLSVQGSQRAY